MEKSKGNQQINPNRIKQAEYERTVYVVTVEMGTTKEDLEAPSFWAHFAAKFRPWDRLEVRCDDGSFYAEYLVLACDRVWAKVHRLSHVTLTTSDISQTQAALQDGLEVKYRGPHLKFGVVRKQDGAVLKEGMQTKQEADQYLSEYRKNVGVPA